MNLIVSLLICLGYAVDYSTDFVLTLLLIEHVIDLHTESYCLSISKIFLTVCIFIAYILLLKVFMTYQRQMTEATAKLAEEKEKSKAKAEKAEARKLE